MKRNIHLTFTTKLVTMICLFHIAAISAVSYLNYQRYSRQVTGQTIAQTQQIIEQTGSNINIYLNELNRLTLAPYYDDDVLHSLELSPRSPEEQLSVSRTIGDFLASAMTLPRDEILRVYIMNDKNIYSYTRTPYEMEDFERYQESGWYRQALSQTKPIYIPPHLEKAFGSRKIPVFSVVRPIRSKKDNTQILGVIKVDADYSGIRKICDRVELEKGGALIITNDENQIIYQTSEQISPDFLSFLTPSKMAGSGHFFTDSDGEKYIWNHYTIASSGLKIIALNSYGELMKPMRENMQKTILLTTACVMVSIAFFTFFIRRFLSPLTTIVQLMRKVEDGDLSVQAPVQTQDEIGYLTLSFNRMVNNLRRFVLKNTQLVKEVYETRYLYKESQYNALCSQIKPHFMYNTLNTISLLVKCGESQSAVRAIEAFSSYLGGIMNVDKEISLQDEIQICLDYLSIMQLRYEDKLTYHMEIDPTLHHCQIPSLSVQPLVENAIKHGCEKSRNAAHIEILARPESAGYLIQVTDNGPGILPEKLRQINEQICTVSALPKNPAHDRHNAEDTTPPQGSIGLINICKRLLLKFGEDTRINIASDCGRGTTVILHIPDKQIGG